MKHIKILTICLPFILGLLTSPTLTASPEGEEAPQPPTTRLSLDMLCLDGDSIRLTATLLIMREGFTYALENAGVGFYVTGATDSLLARVKTTQEGIARITIPVKGLPEESDGRLAFKALFDGNDQYNGGEATVMAVPARLSLSFGMEDSLRILTVTATRKDAAGNDIPLPGETVQIYVPRLYSLMKVGEITLDETGSGTMEFPGNLIGDTIGNLVVVARIEEHDIFGMVQGQNNINWGVPKYYIKAETPSRELWTPVAPLWMIITLIVMLVGVWAHYAYAVYELIMIKRLSRKKEVNV